MKDMSMHTQTRMTSTTPKNRLWSKIRPKSWRFTSSHIKMFARAEKGATAIEYGLIAGLMAIGLAGGLGALSDVIELLFQDLETETQNLQKNPDPPSQES